MKLYVVRHGETDSNVKGIVSGVQDEGINKNGIKQAQAINQKLEGVKFVAVYVSPMARAVETAEIVVPEYKYNVDSRISERELGDLKGYAISELWKNPLWNSLDVCRTPEGAETFLAGYQRVKDFMGELKKKYRKDDKILIVTHSFVSRCIWSVATGIMDMEVHKSFVHKNDEVKVFEW
ncbi:histidine phosphatase family protein [Candidatus Saccharibacteria bacterium]|nr:histidine phosphatase family protein [Candidatus Saccharibacteria bacterium]